MPVSMESLIEDILQRSDSITICFYKNGLEGEAYQELNKLLESVASLYEYLLQVTAYGEIINTLNAVISVLNSSLELDDTVKICDLLNFELRPLLLRLGEQ